MDFNNSVPKSQQRGGVIYVITNKLNGKQYVGQTIQKLSVRLSRHRNDKRPGISQAIQKYGWENFSVEVLEECKSREKLNEREIFWIAKLNTKTPNGYNLTTGGKGGGEHIVTEETRKKLSESHLGQKAYWRGKNIPEEVRAKVSAGMKKYYAEHPEAKKRLAEINKGKKHSAEEKAKISIANSGKNNPMYGRPSPKKDTHLSAETKAKISAATKGKKKHRKNKFIEGSLFDD